MRISFIVYVVLYKYQTSSSNSIGLLATLRGSTLVIVCVYINAIADAAWLLLLLLGLLLRLHQHAQLIGIHVLNCVLLHALFLLDKNLLLLQRRSPYSLGGNSYGFWQILPYIVIVSTYHYLAAIACPYLLGLLDL